MTAQFIQARSLIPQQRLARVRGTYASVTKCPGEPQRHWEGSAEWFLLGFTLAPISSSCWACIKWSKEWNCVVLISKQASFHSSQVISNKLWLQLSPLCFWHYRLSALPPKPSHPWLMVYKMKGRSLFLLVFLAERKSRCRSLCSQQEWGLIIFKMKGRSRKTPLRDELRWSQSGLKEWWASGLISFPGYLIFNVWRKHLGLCMANLIQAGISVFTNWVSSCTCWGIIIQHCHHAFHSTLINLEIQAIHLVILTVLQRPSEPAFTRMS